MNFRFPHLALGKSRFMMYVGGEPSVQIPVLFDPHIQRNFPYFRFRLPTEILEDIFIHYARDYHTENNGRPMQSVPDWVNVSYVCRYWRSVALNCPPLWTYLFMISPRWTDELLARSKQAPLKLHLKLHPQDDALQGLCFVEQVTNYMEHVEELRLHIPFACSVSGYQFVSNFSSPALRLRVLEISVVNQPDGWSSKLFDGDTPALRTLILTSCPVPWHSFKLAGLTKLSLRHTPDEFQQSSQEFLATLRCMQELTHLDLHDALSSAARFLSSEAFHTFQKFSLPRLSRLSIVGLHSAVIAILSCVDIPLKAEVKLDCFSEDSSSPDDYMLLSSSFARRFGMSKDQASPAPTISSSVIQLMRGMTALTFYTSGCDISISTTQGGLSCNTPLQVTIRFGQSMTTRDRDRIASDVCCLVPLTKVQSVHLITPPYPSVFWSETLGRLYDLRYLKLSHSYMLDPSSLPHLAS